jgi:hypothetical protein
MGTKTMTLFLSWIISGLNNAYMPYEWYWLFMSEISARDIIFGICLSYSIFVLCWDYERIIIGIQTLWEFEIGRFKGWKEKRKLKKQNKL